MVVVPVTRRASALSGGRLLRPLGRALLAVLQYGALAAATVVVCAHFVVGLSLHGVLSNSMRPTFTAGDFLVTVDRDPVTLRTGQVPLLTFADGATRAHRIVQVTEERGTVRLLTRGDANPATDTWTDIDAEVPVPVVVTSLPAVPATVAHAVRGLHANPLPAALVIGLGGFGVTAYAVRLQYVRLRDCECADCAAHRQVTELEEIR